ncbi:polynucleotide adenylyltransferase [Besnoitia besnoiti]|uniref:Polynucleotide adenylyltransferase n=1 Tax=Besnoitia besnoiti TaxID=94643 RepID=A0A2A9M6F6_BESBE|nr:polynucleotide adenylyltransferase [Besnoitia besnoiti]PFH31217.1 polynucleotide adenylyltransferase [Besnoitia besnoiti]
MARSEPFHPSFLCACRVARRRGTQTRVFSSPASSAASAFRTEWATLSSSANESEPPPPTGCLPSARHRRCGFPRAYPSALFSVFSLRLSPFPSATRHFHSSCSSPCAGLTAWVKPRGQSPSSPSSSYPLVCLRPEDALTLCAASRCHSWTTRFSQASLSGVLRPQLECPTSSPRRGQVASSSTAFESLLAAVVSGNLSSPSSPGGTFRFSSTPSVFDVGPPPAARRHAFFGRRASHFRPSSRSLSPASVFDSRAALDDGDSSSDDERAAASALYGALGHPAGPSRKNAGDEARDDAFRLRPGTAMETGENHSSSWYEGRRAQPSEKDRMRKAVGDTAVRRMLEKEDLVREGVMMRRRSEGPERSQGQGRRETDDAHDENIAPLLGAFAAIQQRPRKKGRGDRRSDAGENLDSHPLPRNAVMPETGPLGSHPSSGHCPFSDGASRPLSSGREAETEWQASDDTSAAASHTSGSRSSSSFSPAAQPSPGRRASVEASASALGSRFDVFVAPSVFEALTSEMCRLEALMLPGTEDQAGMQRFLSQLQDLLNGVLDACVVTPFGSAVNGLWTPQSDLDVCVQVRDASTRAGQIKVLRQIAHALQPVLTHLIEPRFQARVPIIHWTPRFSHTFKGVGALSGRSYRHPVFRSLLGTTCDDRRDKLADGGDVAAGGGRGRAPSRDCERERNSQMVSCDISVNNLLAVVNSKLLGAYVGIEPRLRTLGYAVKLWAKGRNINDRSRGTVSSFSLVLMLIHFLQNNVQPCVLPSLQDMAIRQRLPPVYIGGVDCRYTADPEAVKKELEFLRGGAPPNTETVGELLLQFFRYFGYEYRGGVIAIRDISQFALSPSQPNIDRWGADLANYRAASLFRDRRSNAASTRRALLPQRLHGRGGDGVEDDEATGIASFASDFAGSGKGGTVGDGDIFDSPSASLRDADLHSTGGDYLVVDNPFEVGKDVCNVLPCQYQRIRHEFKRAFRMLADGASFRQVAAPDGRTTVRL